MFFEPRSLIIFFVFENGAPSIRLVRLIGEVVQVVCCTQGRLPIPWYTAKDHQPIYLRSIPLGPCQPRPLIGVLESMVGSSGGSLIDSATVQPRSR